MPNLFSDTKSKASNSKYTTYGSTNASSNILMLN